MKAKKKSQLRIKDHLGPFVCNNKRAGQEAEQIIERKMHLKKSFAWAYDPHGFISDRRTKHKLSPYIHHRIPEIEQYASLNEWREGTLIEEDSNKVEVENVMKDLEKRLDMDSFVHVPAKTSQKQTLVQVPAETSQKPTQETSAPTVKPSQRKTQETSLGFF